MTHPPRTTFLALSGHSCVSVTSSEDNAWEQAERMLVVFSWCIAPVGCWTTELGDMFSGTGIKLGKRRFSLLPEAVISQSLGSTPTKSLACTFETVCTTQKSQFMNRFIVWNVLTVKQNDNSVVQSSVIQPSPLHKHRPQLPTWHLLWFVYKPFLRQWEEHPECSFVIQLIRGHCYY